MTELEVLLQYQEVDGKLRAIEQEIASSEERKKFFSAKKFLEKASGKLEVLDNRALAMSRSAAALQSKYAELEESLSDFSALDDLLEEGADLAYYKKQALAISEQLRSVKAELLQLTAAIRDAQKEYAALKQQTLAAQKQFKEYRVRYSEVKEGRAAEMAALEKQLAAIEKEGNPAVMAKYKAKRKEHIFPIIGALRNNRCPFCGMDLPIALQSRLSAGKVIECDSCHRLIYQS